MNEAIAKGFALGLLLAISVGPVIFSIIKQSVNNGHKGGLSFAIGVALSDVTLVLISNVFTEFFNRLLRFEQLIGIGGSLLLISIGLYYLFFKKVVLREDGMSIHLQLKAADYARIFVAGYFMNTLNPGVIAFWFTWATAFIAIPIQERIALFGTCLSVVFTADLLKVFLANKLRQKLTPPIIHRINQISGLILIVFGLFLIIGLLYYRS
ncbi:MAG: LysE family translocator [Lacibacter sp.]|jgi:threonine/homoserine/homoserine lactone efflux protein